MMAAWCALFVLEVLPSLAANLVVISHHKQSKVPIQHSLKMLDSLFGFTPYGSSIAGIVHYANDGCSVSEDAVTRWNGHVLHTAPILLIDRGSCTFSTKVRLAQKGGARAAIVIDNTNEPIKAMSTYDNDDASDILIPSVFISQKDGAYIKQAIQSSTETKQKPVHIVLRWHAAKRVDTVHWQAWAPSFDPHFLQTVHGVPLLSDFSLIARALGPAAPFTPHFFIVPGEVYQCTVPVKRADGNKGFMCGSHCANRGKYCVNPHEIDPRGFNEGKVAYTGFEGKTLIQEDLRQICIFDWVRNHKTDGGRLWWEYVDGFLANCSNPATITACSQAVEKRLGIDSKNITRCLAGAEDRKRKVKTNKLLQQEMATQFELRVVEGGQAAKFVGVVINGKQFSGRLDCPHPIRYGCVHLLHLGKLA